MSVDPAAPCPLADWPYPRWIAHRGAGHLAPENTLAAVREGARRGWRMLECDAQLSADGQVFLLHDHTLDRTTDGHGIASQQTWAQLARLDAGRWHSALFAGEPIPALDSIAAFCLAHGQWLNIEIKPLPGQGLATGRGVAQTAGRLWHAAEPDTLPLLTSFDPLALVAARIAAPHLPRGLLLDRLWNGWTETALQLECAAVVAHHPLWNTDLQRHCRQHGWRTAAYTVNDTDTANRLLTLGLDSLITDRLDLFDPTD